MTQVLAQGLAVLDAPAPPPLPQAPFLESLFLENPTLLAILAVGLALIAYAAFATRGHARQARIAIACGLLTVTGIVTLATLVDTDRERLDRVTRQLVASVAQADGAALDQLITDDGVLLSPLSGPPLQKPGILSRVSTDFPAGRQYHIREYHVQVVQATLDSPTQARVQVKVIVTPEEAPSPTPVWARIDFSRRADGDWRASGIQVLSVGGVVGAGIR